MASKTTYRIDNWSQYNQALVERGSLSVWISEEAIDHWEYDGPSQWGEDYTYSDFAIEACLRLRLVYHLALRQTEGFVTSLFRLMHLDVPVPDYSTLSRRAAALSVDLCLTSNNRDHDEPRHIVIDSTGLKVYGEGEWKQRQHGKSKRRTWRKLHVGMDVETGEITAERLTENDKHDASQVEALLEQTTETMGSLTHVGGDGAYDTWKSYQAIEAVGARPVIPPQKNAKIKKHGNSKGPRLPRDEAIRYIRRHGRSKWKRVHGYHVRSLAETAIYRFKQVIGRMLRSRTIGNQCTEARLGCQILNRMLGLGMPESYAVVLA